MTLGTRLYNIAQTEGTQREQLIQEFKQDIANHKEEKLLAECLAAAERGRNFIDLGKKVLTPQSLEAEGFFLVKSGNVYNYCWE